jgi:hypothetical protein
VTRLKSDLQVFESVLNNSAAAGSHSSSASAAAGSSSSSSSAVYNEQPAAVHPTVALPGDEVAIRPNAAEDLWVLANVQVLNGSFISSCLLSVLTVLVFAVVFVFIVVHKMCGDHQTDVDRLV